MESNDQGNNLYDEELQQTWPPAGCLCVQVGQEQAHPGCVLLGSPWRPLAILEPTYSHTLLWSWNPLLTSWPHLEPLQPEFDSSSHTPGYLASAAAAWTAPGTEVTRKWDSWFSLVNRRSGTPNLVADWSPHLPIKLISLDNRGNSALRRRWTQCHRTAKKISQWSLSPRLRGRYTAK